MASRCECVHYEATITHTDGTVGRDIFCFDPAVWYGKHFDERRELRGIALDCYPEAKSVTWAQADHCYDEEQTDAE